MTHPRPMGSAFTLVEFIGVIAIMSVLASVVAPLLLNAANAHASAVERRRASIEIGSAMERIVRVIREAPATASGDSTPDITTAEPAHIAFGDGHVVQLVGTTLQLTIPGESAAPLCTGVTTFELSYLGADGVTDTSTNPTDTCRIEVRLVASDVEIRTCAFVRIAMSSP